VNTSKASGAAAPVVSAGLDHGVSLRPDETRELLEQTAERVLTGNGTGTGTPDPGADPTLPADEQWSSHFGWGRADVGAAVGAVVAGNIPAEAAIDSPDWYAPLTGSSVDVTGLARARFATGGQLHWKLMWGAGRQPSSWTTVREGDSSGTVTDFGALGHTGSPGLAALGLPREPARGPLIADLTNKGRLSVIVAAGTHIYAWKSNGKPVRGFPVSSNPAFCGPALENDNSHPKCGFAA